MGLPRVFTRKSMNITVHYMWVSWLWMARQCSRHFFTFRVLKQTSKLSYFSPFNGNVGITCSLCFSPKSESNILDVHLDSRKLKPWPNGCNMLVQHHATLLHATWCVRLATMVHNVAFVWPTLLIMMQHDPTMLHATCCIVWPGLNSLHR